LSRRNLSRDCTGNIQTSFRISEGRETQTKKGGMLFPTYILQGLGFRMSSLGFRAYLYIIFDLPHLLQHMLPSNE
jgi:hypothetical protein